MKPVIVAIFLILLIFSCGARNGVSTQERFHRVYYSGRTEVTTKYYPFNIHGTNQDINMAFISGYPYRTQREEPTVVMMMLWTHYDTSQIVYNPYIVCQKNGRHYLSFKLYKDSPKVMYGWASFEMFKRFFVTGERPRSLTCSIQNDSIVFDVPYNTLSVYRRFIDNLVMD